MGQIIYISTSRVVCFKMTFITLRTIGMEQVGSVWGLSVDVSSARTGRVLSAPLSGWERGPALLASVRSAGRPRLASVGGTPLIGATSDDSCSTVEQAHPKH